jgi:phosphoglycolate phosphatase-like HAD superfamily hydrolase
VRLILFDIDGTLISSGGAGTKSMDMAFEDLFGISGAFREISMAGKTDLQIIREGLCLHAQMTSDGVIPKAQKAYLSHLSGEIHRTTSKHLKPGILSALQALRQTPEEYSLGLLTGNLQEGARIKLKAFGIYDYFLSGAFGSDNEDRNKLLPIVVDRFSVILNRRFSYQQCIIVGDTPRDVDCAKPYGARCLAVATGPYNAEELQSAGADFVMTDLSDTQAFLETIRLLA